MSKEERGRGREGQDQLPQKKDWKVCRGEKELKEKQNSNRRLARKKRAKRVPGLVYRFDEHPLPSGTEGPWSRREQS